VVISGGNVDPAALARYLAIPRPSATAESAPAAG
jgi:hypothetical protein